MPSIKLATWNVNSLRVRLPHVMGWLASNPVDVLAIQETKIVDDKFPVAELREIVAWVNLEGRTGPGTGTERVRVDVPSGVRTADVSVLPWSSVGSHAWPGLAGQAASP